MKCFLVIGAVLLLGGCGHDVRTPAPIGQLVQAGIAPWLTVAGGAATLDVRGLDHKLILEPAPALAAAMQSQLGMRLKPDYFPDLVVTCSDLTAEMRVDTKKDPDHVAMKLGMHCKIWARGFDTQQDYAAQVSTPVQDGSSDQAYAQALPVLLGHGAGDLAGQLHGDLRKLAH